MVILIICVQQYKYNHVSYFMQSHGIVGMYIHGDSMFYTILWSTNYLDHSKSYMYQ